MSNQEDQFYQPDHQSDSQCPECKKKYSESGSQSGSASQERIVIPLRRQFLNNSNSQIQGMLKNLQDEVENLKRINIDKDRVIEDLRREIDHKMTHYMLKGEITKQADQINRLKSELNQASNLSFVAKNPEVNLNEIRNIVREETDRYVSRNHSMDVRNHSMEMRNLPSEAKKPKRKHNQTKTDINSRYKTEYLQAKTAKQAHFDIPMDFQEHKDEEFDDYFQLTQRKGVFKIGEAKRKIIELEQKLKNYELEMLWMSNFVITFIRTMQNIAFKKYQEQIVIPEWSLKKKAKTSWRYMKHILKFLMDQPLN